MFLSVAVRSLGACTPTLYISAPTPITAQQTPRGKQERELNQQPESVTNFVTTTDTDCAECEVGLGEKAKYQHFREHSLALLPNGLALNSTPQYYGEVNQRSPTYVTPESRDT